MEKIPTIKLQELANVLHEEQNTSLRRQLSAWCVSNANNPEHSPLSLLSSMAEQSTIKDKINNWVSNLTNPMPEFDMPKLHFPDMPAQMTDEQAASVEESNDVVETLPEEIISETPIAEVTEETAPETPTPEEPKIKKTRKKKVD